MMDAGAVVQGFIDDWSAGQIEAGSAWLAPDFERFGVETGWKPMSRADYVFWWKGFAPAFPDARWEVLDFVAGKDTVAVQLIERGTFTAAWDLGQLVVQPNGKPYVTRAALFFRIENGKIRSYDYLHDGGFMAAYADLFPDAAATAPALAPEAAGA